MSTTTASRTTGRRSLVIAVAIAAVIATVAAGAPAWWHDRQRDDEWAHGGDDVTVTARITATTRAGYPDALAAAGVEEEPADAGARQWFVIEVDWHGSPEPDGSYAFLLLDGRLNPPEPLGAASAWGEEGATGASWDGRYAALAEHYPWLARTAARQNADGSYSDTAEALLLPDTPRGEGGAVLSFYLPRPELATSRSERDLVLAMVRTDGDGEVRWARKVPLGAS